MHTLIIAPTLSEAQDAAQRESLLICPPYDTQISTPDFGAYTLLGRTPERVIIVDCTKWHSSTPGRVTELWEEIQRMDHAWDIQVLWRSR